MIVLFCVVHIPKHALSFLAVLLLLLVLTRTFFAEVLELSCFRVETYCVFVSFDLCFVVLVSELFELPDVFSGRFQLLLYVFEFVSVGVDSERALFKIHRLNCKDLALLHFLILCKLVFVFFYLFVFLFDLVRELDAPQFLVFVDALFVVFYLVVDFFLLSEEGL